MSAKYSLGSGQYSAVVMAINYCQDKISSIQIGVSPDATLDAALMKVLANMEALA